MRTALLLLGLIAMATTARSGTAECGVDLDLGRFTWVLPGGEVLDPIDVPQARVRLARLDSLLATGDPADELRASLGRDIFGPYIDQIDPVQSWKFVPELVQGLPGTLGALAALAVPARQGEPAVARHRVSLGWPRPLRQPLPRARKSSTGSILMSAPFATDVDPALDDPDTLREALRDAVRTVRLVPRNEAGTATLRRALEESAPGLWWFRGDADQLAGLQPAFGALPQIVVWTLPSRSISGPPALTPMTLASGGTAPECVVVSTRAVSESELAPLVRDFADGLARGLGCEAALQEAQAHALADGASIPVASCLVAIGRSESVAHLDRSSWLRRWFR